MKKLLFIIPLLLCGCSIGSKEKVLKYTYSYLTSQVQETTKDCKLAVISEDRYIEVDDNYTGEYVNVKYTGNVIYYYVYDTEQKVSNKGYEKCR